MIEDATKTQACAILNEAAELIETHGWIRGSYGSPEHGFCALGSMYWVISRLGGIHYDADLLCREALKEVIPGGLSITRWNDSRRSPKTVTDALRKAAKNLCS